MTIYAIYRMFQKTIFNMRDLRFHIIVPYYKRQKIVANALASIINSEYDNWFLTFIDDSGNRGFEEIFYSYRFNQKKVEYVPISMSDDAKIANGGSVFGSFINQAIKRIDSDIIITLCDDDAITSDYMKKLNKYYNDNQDILWSYCHLIFYNPNDIPYHKAKETDFGGALNSLNSHTEPINPSNKVDSSQVTFRRSIFLDYGIEYPSPQTANLDAYVFSSTHSKVGNCPFNNIKGQYKASFSDQLGARISSRRGEYIKL